MNTSTSEQHIIAPKQNPTDESDRSIGIRIGILQIAIIIVAPALLVGITLQSIIFGVLASIVICGLFFCFSVSCISLSEDGIHFKRTLGSPRFLTWDSICCIEEAPRTELIIRGWLWPPIPAREMTACPSSVGHYRITWKTGYCYYPPADPQLFESLVEKMKNIKNKSRKDSMDLNQ